MDKTILFIANNISQLTSSRRLIIDEFLDKDWEVVLMGSVKKNHKGYREKGVIIEDMEIDRSPFSPITDVKTMKKIISTYRRYKPDLIHCFHIKPIILGNLAKMFFSRQSKLVNTITGLGYAFYNKGITRKIASLAYKVSLRGCDRTIFQNPDDRDLFIKNHLINLNKAEVILSSGINPDKFKYSPETQNNKIKILIATRLLWQKGIREFVEAAEKVKKKRNDVEFQVAGGFEEEHMDGINREWIEEKDKQGTINYLGYVEDMPSKLAEIDIFTLPSYYREGVPRANLEAMASGKPIVTTDAPGCRETVIKNRNGILVPPKNSEDLAEALLELIDNKEKREKMGKEGRKIIEERFDIKDITEKYLDIYKEVGIKVD